MVPRGELEVALWQRLTPPSPSFCLLGLHQLLSQENKVVEKDERSDHEFLSDSDKELPLAEDEDHHHKKTN